MWRVNGQGGGGGGGVNRAVFRVVDFFFFALFAILFSPYFPLVLLQPSLHTILKYFPKFCQN